MLAKELGYAMLNRKVDTRFAFYDRLLQFDEKTTFQHFDFVRKPEEDAAAKCARHYGVANNSPVQEPACDGGKRSSRNCKTAFARDTKLD